MLLHEAACFLKHRGVKQLHVDSQRPERCGNMDISDRSWNDPIAFYIACGCIEIAQCPSAEPCDTSVPMAGDIDNIIAQCSRKLDSAQPQHVRLIPPIYTGPTKAHVRMSTSR